MKIQRILIALTVLNLGLMMFLLTQIRRGEASTSGPSVLRGSSLEIVDDQGKVRASIKIHPADPNVKMPDGKTGIPETVMFRLIDPNGRPEVKIGASVDGAGLGFVGGTDSTHLILEAQGADSSLKLVNKAGRQQLIKP